MDFLSEARGRFGGLLPDLFNQAITHYQRVAERLGDLTKTYPFIAEHGSQTIPVDEQCLEAVDWLKDARQAEAKSLSVLEQIVENL